MFELFGGWFVSICVLSIACLLIIVFSLVVGCDEIAAIFILPLVFFGVIIFWGYSIYSDVEQKVNSASTALGSLQQSYYKEVEKLTNDLEELTQTTCVENIDTVINYLNKSRDKSHTIEYDEELGVYTTRYADNLRGEANTLCEPKYYAYIYFNFRIEDSVLYVDMISPNEFWKHEENASRLLSYMGVNMVGSSLIFDIRSDTV